MLSKVLIYSHTCKNLAIQGVLKKNSKTCDDNLKYPGLKPVEK
jgi:hypothetical protein